MHIFLTGEIQIGKSTVIARTLPLLEKTYGGFRTSFGPDRQNHDRVLYMNDASGADVFTKDHVVAAFRKGELPEAFTDSFNTLGSKYLLKAKKHAQLIIMDECGFLEIGATVFQNEILNILNGDIPVLGVLRQTAAGWINQIRTHPKVTIFTVNESNRDILPYKLRDKFI
ncbi:MAG: nucleotide kinase [Clostridiales bacterium]|jgi:nucleoside-triphosphatase|nr:nucleotide kinase [Clostridiales bacterium]